MNEAIKRRLSVKLWLKKAPKGASENNPMTECRTIQKRCDNWTVLGTPTKDTKTLGKKGEEKKEIIRRKTIYEEDLFLMRSRIDYRFLIYLARGNVREGEKEKEEWISTANI